ncbi:DUF2267 domain-containing protein [Nocardia australiensis]|uniref:DUF2267 domain-containing protein n=1 Tax=Nocardia australiensis TaxID=2887191 RepID=UPI001D1563EC|nr:DUF2267 domain-containing protein [Nocardia australiensis]
MPRHVDPFAPTVDRAHKWLGVIAGTIGTDDRAFTYRVVRAWLHTVRDRIGVDAAAHSSAQLPELFRGVFFEGWIPSRVPVNHHVDEFIEQFASAAGIAEVEVPALAGSITDAMDSSFSPGHLLPVFAVLPGRLGDILAGSPTTRSQSRQTRTSSSSGRRHNRNGIDASSIRRCGRLRHISGRFE